MENGIKYDNSKRVPQMQNMWTDLIKILEVTSLSKSQNENIIILVKLKKRMKITFLLGCQLHVCLVGEYLGVSSLQKQP